MPNAPAAALVRSPLRKADSMDMVKTERVYQGFAKYIVASFRRADGTTVRREVEDHGEAVAVLAYDPARKRALLVRQFRAPLFLAGAAAYLIEAIAGLKEDENPEQCARREAMEEAGVALNALEHVASVWSLPGVSTERMHLFLASFSAADQTGHGGGRADEEEEIEVVELGLSELARRADAGEITDLKTLALVQSLRLRRPDLFAP